MISTEILSQFSLFDGLPDSLLKEIAGISNEVSVKKDDFVFVGVSLSFTFMSMQCPTPSGSSTYR